MTEFINSESRARWQGFQQWTEALNQSGISENWRFDLQNPFFFAEAEAKRLPMRDDHIRFIATYDSKQEWFAMKDEWKHLAEAQWAYEDGDMLMVDMHLAIAQESRELAEAYDRAERREMAVAV
jgi:hypothetical protein